MEPTDRNTPQSANVGNSNETDLSRVMGPSSGEFPLAGKPIPRSIPWESATLNGSCKQDGLVEGTVRILDLDWKWDKKEFADYPTTLEDQINRLQRGYELERDLFRDACNASENVRPLIEPVLSQIEDLCHKAKKYLERHFDEKNPHTAESALYKMAMPFVEHLEANKENLASQEQASEFRSYTTFFQRSIAIPDAPSPYAPIPPGTILVANTMSLAHLVRVVPERNIVGFICQGTAGHAVIQATSLGWVGITNVDRVDAKIATGELANGSHIYMDGRPGSIWLNPASDWIAEFHREKKERLPANILMRIPHQRATTRCGQREILISASIGNEGELANIEKVWPEGTGDIGLFRTEVSLTAVKALYEEDRQYEIYKKVIAAPHTDTPVIRLVDWGGEKTNTDYTRDGSQMRDRGIRHSLLNDKTRSVLRVQLRALLRASEHGHVKILVPMVTDVEEIDEVYNELQRSREELAERDIFPPVENASLGVMIEVGGAVEIIEDILKHVDFVSIGSGDLTQYVLGVERDFTAGSNQDWLKRFAAHHPAVIRKMKKVVEAACMQGKKVHGCGDIFADNRYAPIALGLDLHSISTHPLTAAGMFQELSGLDYAPCKAFVDWVVESSGGRGRAVYDELERFHECVKRGELWEPPTPKQSESEPAQPEPIVIRT